MYYAPPGQIIVKYIFHKCINVSCLHTVESFIVSGWNKYTAYLRTRMLRDWTVNKYGEKICRYMFDHYGSHAVPVT